MASARTRDAKAAHLEKLINIYRSNSENPDELPSYLQQHAAKLGVDVNNISAKPKETATSTDTTQPQEATQAAEEAAAPVTEAEKKINFNLEGSLSEALQQLIDQYNNAPVYEAQTAEQMKERAEGEYQSYYDQLRLAAKQAQESQDLALSQQAEGLQATYDKAREASAKEYRQAYSKADRQMLSRGMQRSSYNAQTLANLSQQGAEAQQSIWDQQAAAENNIAAQRTQLAQQLAQQLSQYDASYAADVLNRIRELEDKDYERQMQNTEYLNTLSGQIFGYLQNYLQWNGGATGGYDYTGGGTTKKKSSGSSGSTKDSTQTTAQDNYKSFMDTLNAGASASSSVQKITSNILKNTANFLKTNSSGNSTSSGFKKKEETTKTKGGLSGR